jgi:hypothetical protein
MMLKKQIILTIILLLPACTPHQNKNSFVANNSAPVGVASKFSALLERAETGRSYDTVTASGKAVNFIVEEEYISANNTSCKKFIINTLPHLACSNGRQWLDVRAF